MTAFSRIALVSCAVVFLALITSCGKEGIEEPAPLSYAQGDSIAITGILIDSRCFSLDPANTGVDHERPEGPVIACAQACAKAGFPVAVLVDGDPNGDVWVLVTVPAVFSDFMAETVRVRGTVRSAGVLIPERVAYRSNDEWITIM